MEVVKREIKFHRSLDHPHIIKLYDYFKSGNKVYLLMEYAKNGNLFHYIRKRKRVSELEAAKIWIQTCRGIEYMHKHGLIHRDIKPENMLLDENKNIKICDFGWSIDNSTDMRQTFCGTYEYMAPEILGGGGYDYRVDIWGLGILLYELIHGFSPFKGENTADIFMKIKKGVPKFGSSVSEEVKQIILAILQKDNKNRPSFNNIFNSPFFKKWQEVIDKEDTNTNEFNNSQLFKSYQDNQKDLKNKKIDNQNMNITKLHPSNSNANDSNPNLNLNNGNGGPGAGLGNESTRFLRENRSDNLERNQKNLLRERNQNMGQNSRRSGAPADNAGAGSKSLQKNDSSNRNLAKENTFAKPDSLASKENVENQKSKSDFTEGADSKRADSMKSLFQKIGALANGSSRTNSKRKENPGFMDNHNFHLYNNHDNLEQKFAKNRSDSISLIQPSKPDAGNFQHPLGCNLNKQNYGDSGILNSYQSNSGHNQNSKSYISLHKHSHTDRAGFNSNSNMNKSYNTKSHTYSNNPNQNLCEPMGNNEKFTGGTTRRGLVTEILNFSNEKRKLPVAGVLGNITNMVCNGENFNLGNLGQNGLGVLGMNKGNAGSKSDLGVKNTRSNSHCENLSQRHRDGAWGQTNSSQVNCGKQSSVESNR
jgi:serine/threonine protein kinase